MARRKKAEDFDSLPPYVPPSLEKAWEHRAETTPHLMVGKKREPYNLWRTTPLELGSMGVGIGLYFKTMKSFAGLMAAVAIVATVGAAMNVLAYSSLGPVDYYQTLTRFTLAGMTDTAAPGSAEVAQFELWSGYWMDKRDVLLIMAILDMVGVLILLLGAAYMRHSMTKDQQWIDQANITLGDFSVIVTSLPANTELDELCALFSQYGEVVDVVLAKNDGCLTRLLEKHKKEVDKLESLKCMAAKTHKAKFLRMAEACEDQLYATEERIGELARDVRFDTIASVVTFETKAAQYQCVMNYPDSVHGWMMQRKAKRLRGKYRLRVRAAPEPDNILWENLEYGWWDRKARKLVTALVSVLLLAVSVTLASMAKGAEAHLPPSVKCQRSEKEGSLHCANLWNLTRTYSNDDPIRNEVYDLRQGAEGAFCRQYVMNGMFIENVTMAMVTDAVAALSNGNDSAISSSDDSVVQCAALTCYGCYCQTQGLPYFVHDVSGDRSYCQHYWLYTVRNYVLHGLAIGFVAIINLLLYIVLPVVTKWEKHHRVSYLEAATSEKLMVAQLLNCAVIAVVVYADIQDLQFWKLKQILFGGLYTDFDPDWYSDVGTSLVYTLVIQIGVPFVITIGITLYGYVARRLLPYVIVTQRSLDKQMEGMEFVLSERYGQLLTLVFFTWIFSSGIPLLNLILIVGVLVTFWVDKATLLYASRLPPHYDEGMAVLFLELLPWAAWIHLAVAVWMFGGLPSRAIANIVPPAQGVADRINLNTPPQFNVVQRIMMLNVFPLFVFWVCISIYLMLRPFVSIVESLSILFCSSNKVAPEGVPLTLRQALADGRVLGLKSYNRFDNPRYALPDSDDTFRSLDHRILSRLLENLDTSLVKRHPLGQRLGAAHTSASARRNSPATSAGISPAGATIKTASSEPTTISRIATPKGVSATPMSLPGKSRMSVAADMSGGGTPSGTERASSEGAGPRSPEGDAPSNNVQRNGSVVLDEWSQEENGSARAMESTSGEEGPQTPLLQGNARGEVMGGGARVGLDSSSNGQGEASEVRASAVLADERVQRKLLARVNEDIRQV